MTESGLLERARRYAIANHVPLYSTIELTLSCNLKCTHCYNFDRAEPMPRRLRESQLPSARVFTLIDELAEEGCLFLSFTGGEALLHPELLAFVRRARERSMAVRLKSNGIALTAARAEALAGAGCTDVDISMYGATAATHDAFTAVPGSFERTLNGVRASLRAGVQPKVNFVLHRDCFNEVGEMRALADRLSVPHELSTELTARYEPAGSKAGRDPRDRRLTLEQLEALYRGPLKDLAAQVPNPGADDDPQGGIQCVCATMVCGISAAGEVFPCIGAPIPSGNLREKSFHEIWRNSATLNRIRGLKLPDFKDCAPCADRAYCQRSSGSMQVSTGEYTGSEEWVCGEAAVLRKLHEESI